MFGQSHNLDNAIVQIYYIEAFLPATQQSHTHTEAIVSNRCSTIHPIWHDSHAAKQHLARIQFANSQLLINCIPWTKSDIDGCDVHHGNMEISFDRPRRLVKVSGHRRISHKRRGQKTICDVLPIWLIENAIMVNDEYLKMSILKSIKGEIQFREKLWALNCMRYLKCYEFLIEVECNMHVGRRTTSRKPIINNCSSQIKRVLC